MPIYHKPAQAITAAATTNEIDDHTSDAAKVKRTREQAYFNSYDFDAIEVLPYDDEDDEEVEELEGIVAADGPVRFNSKPHSGASRQLPFNKQSQTARPINAKSQKRLQNASLSSKSNSSVPSSNSSRSSTSLEQYALTKTAPQIATTKAASNEQLNYLQRLGAFFKKSDSATAHARQRSATDLTYNAQQPPAQRELVLDVRNCVSLVDENFLLPRAILKYQSAGNATNSMPLTEIAATTTTTANATSATVTGLPTKAITNAKQPLSMGQSKVNNNNNSTSNANNFANNKNGNTGLPAASQQTATAVAAAATLGTTTARTKKQSTCSTTTTATTASIGSHSDVVVASASKSANKTAAPLKANATKQRAPMVRVPTATTTISNSSGELPAHGRASSHQSHYSTDKSGSSGYYSSNVCSTYSLDDHIYCEPVIDIVELATDDAIGNAKKMPNKSEFLAEKRHAKQVAAASLALSMQRMAQSQSKSGGVDGDANGAEEADAEPNGKAKASAIACAANVGKSIALALQHGQSDGEQPYSENLRILETSIENLDRHLKNFPSQSAHERIATFVQAHSNYVPAAADAAHADRQRLHQTHLPTIMEGGTLHAKHNSNWQLGDDDDSLLDIDFDSFLLVNERQSGKRKQRAAAASNGIDNPGFLDDEPDEDAVADNNYKCAKYINSCPEDAYRVESDIEHTARVASSLKRYEDQLHFQNTRELLEDVRDKIRLLSSSRGESHAESYAATDTATSEDVPKELEGMIKTLKHELEAYLERMNQHSELEIRQLCSGLIKSQHIVKMTNAFQRRQSQTNSLVTSDFATYEAIRDGIVAGENSVNASVRHQITTIRCASDPNFKMKRKSLMEVFPIADCYVETTTEDVVSMSKQSLQQSGSNSLNSMTQQITQLQRNLSFHKPMLSQLDAVMMHAAAGKTANAMNLKSGGGGGGGNKGDDRDSLASWHRKKPSIWEMYYGTNRLNQTLLGKRNAGVLVNSNQVTLSYPSSRPESDFTLDLPRAEQLRIKMEKEKKFRQRCRYITTFLSLIFFLLTVMVVSLVLTRGKRMFGSMI